MRRPTLDQAAFAKAIADVAARLAALDVEDAGRHAHDLVRDLVEEGWRHTRPRLDMEPPKGVPADPGFKDQAAAAAREAIARSQEVGP